MRRTTFPAGRGQANLPVVAVALVVLTAVTGMTIAMAEGAYLGAERDAAERATAVSTADRLVAADAEHTRRENVLDAAAIERLNRTDLIAIAPATADADLRIAVGDEPVLEAGDPDGGTTVRRIVLVAETDPWRGTTNADDHAGVTVPRGTASISLDVAGGVETVRVDGRIVVHEPGERDEPIRVPTSRHGTPTVTADGDGGRVIVEARAGTTETAMLEVTIDG